MTKKSKPRAGSLAFYPRKKAKRELAAFRSMHVLDAGKPKPLNFVGYKAGMVHAIAKNRQEKSVSAGQSVIVPATVIECPPMTVFGVRAYTKDGVVLRSLGEVTIEKVDKHFRKKFPSFKRKSQKKKEKAAQKEQKAYTAFEGLEKQAKDISHVRLLCHTKPSTLDFGKKRPDVFEVFLGGNVQEQLAFAKEKLGKEILVSEVFSERQFVDVKAVDIGKGFAGVIKRFGVKQQRPKAKKRRIVGSISPWNPSTVMWTVARAGQLGYQSRTELNKRVLKISSEPEEINVPGGFEGYGNVRGTFMLLAGSTPGPIKRAISMRMPVRKGLESGFNVSDLTIIGLKKSRKTAVAEEEVRAQKVLAAKKEKKEQKSVEDEIRAAAAGVKEKKEKQK